MRSLIACAFVLLSVLLVSCAHQGQPKYSKANSKEPLDSDDLLIVDCLLPGQIRQLGSEAQYLTARRPVKTTALNCRIRGGEYVAYDRANFSTSLKVWLPLAETGDPEAQNYVGEIFERGLGILPDYEQAAFWFKKAADQNDARAQINIGNLYEKGLGVPRDLKKALNYYRRAAGLEGDSLEYLSSIEATHVKLGEYEVLKDQLALQQRERQHIEQKLIETKQALNNNQLKSEHLSDEITILNESLSAAKALLLDPDFTEENDLASKPVKEQPTLKKIQQQLDQKQKDLLKHESAVSELYSQVGRYNEALDGLQHQPAKSEDLTLPKIQIIEPAMTLNRSGPTVRLRSATESREIIGKVTAPAGLLRLLVNNQQQTLDQQSLFWAHIPIKGARTPVEVTAIDKRGERVSFEFTFVAKQAANLLQTASESQTNHTKLNMGRYYALVIGNNNYNDFPDLITARNDAIKAAHLLSSKYGFEVKLLENATRYQILSALNQYRDQLTAQDNLLIYYAGHGELDEINDRGYWLPVDAEASSTANWISNVSISDAINTMSAKHVMVIADSCYAGTLSTASMARPDVLLNPAAKDHWVKVMAKAKARTVLTAGGVSPVRDGGGGEHSVFAKAFLASLKSNDQLLEGYALYLSILKRMNANPNQQGLPQSPDYAPIKHAGHEAGEFFFKPI